MAVKKSMPFAQYYQSWYETYRKPKIEKVSLAKYVGLLNRLEGTKLGSMPLKDIKRKDVQEFLNDFGKTRQKQTVLDHRVMLKASFEDAVLDGLIKVNPCTRLELVSVESNWSIDQLKEHRERKQWLELDEYKKVKFYLLGVLHESFHQESLENVLLKDKNGKVAYEVFVRKNIPQMMIMVIYVALKTGARFAEIIGLTKDDIDFNAGEINIEKTWDYKTQKGFSKTKNYSSIRKIDVDKEFLVVMATYFNWLDKHNIKLDRGAIFIQDKVRIHNSTINIIFREILKVLEIENISLHKLRHTQASILIAEGIQLQVVAKRLGHTDTNMIQQTYGHLLKTTEEKETEKILELI